MIVRCLRNSYCYIITVKWEKKRKYTGLRPKKQMQDWRWEAKCLHSQNWVVENVAVRKVVWIVMSAHFY